MNGTKVRIPRRRPRSRPQAWRAPSGGAALRRMGGLAAAGAGIAMLAAACGGSHPAGSAASSPPNFAAEVNSYAQCLRAHGQPNVAVSRDPGSSDSGTTVMTFHGLAIVGANPALPQVQAAMHACQQRCPRAPAARRAVAPAVPAGAAALQVHARARVPELAGPASGEWQRRHAVPPQGARASIPVPRSSGPRRKPAACRRRPVDGGGTAW